jgi:Protein of unknown function (DUF1176)
MRIFLALLLIWLGVLPAVANETATPPPYSDDRSDAGAVVRSLYNAVNRHEFARAWGYFGNPPSKDFEAFVKGYDDTAFVDVFTGRINSEGAAGSTFSHVAVAIRAMDGNGKTKIFAGCYTVKAVNPQIQEPPFRAPLIEKAALKAVDDTVLSGAAPEWCGEGKAPAETADELLTRTTALFVLQNRDSCDKIKDARGPDGAVKPETYELRFHSEGETSADPERLYRLYEFACTLYAYNASVVYYLANDFGEISKLSFAEPHMDIKYADEWGAKLKSMVVDGFTSSDTLIDSSFDAATATLSSFNKWRGIGDASSTGTWKFIDGQFVLTGYDVDPTTDDEINPISVIVDGQIKH